MKTSLVLTSVAIAAATTLGGCGTGMRKALGVQKTVPDEFRVVTKAPLVVPPDYALRPPRPGEPRPSELSKDASAEVFGQDIGQRASEGERVLVAKAGAGAVDPTVRSQVDFEGSALVRKNEQYADALMNYGKPGSSAPDGKTALDEQEAIRRATGGGTVVIQREDKKHFKLPGL